MDKLGRIIRAKRQINGFSQENLAKAIGKSQHWVSMFENGQRKVDDHTLSEICEFLNIDHVDYQNKSYISDIDTEEIIINFVKSFKIISKEMDRLTELKNKIKDKFFEL